VVLPSSLGTWLSFNPHTKIRCHRISISIEIGACSINDTFRCYGSKKEGRKIRKLYPHLTPAEITELMDSTTNSEKIISKVCSQVHVVNVTHKKNNSIVLQRSNIRTSEK
jgi:hypothetical protein